MENLPKLPKTINKPPKTFKNRQNCPKSVRKTLRNVEKPYKNSKICRKTVKKQSIMLKNSKKQSKFRETAQNYVKLSTNH